MGLLMVWTLVMIALRFYGALSLPLSFDELIQYDTISKFNLIELLSYLRKHDWQMPLNYLLTFPFIKSGFHHPLWLRLPSLIFSFLSLFFFYLYCRKRMNKIFAWSGVALLASSFLSLKYAFSMRPYGLFLMLCCLALLCFEKLKEEMDRGEIRISMIFSYGATFFLLFFTHLFGVLVVGMFLFWTYRELNRRHRLWTRYPWSHFFGLTLLILPVGLGAFYLLAHPLFPHPNHQGPSLEKILYAVFHFFGGSLIFGIACVFLLLKKTRERLFPFPLFELSFLLLIPLMSLLFSFIFYPLYEIRFFIFTIPMGILLLLGLLYEKGGFGFLCIILIPLILAELSFNSLYREGVFQPQLDMRRLEKEIPNIQERPSLFCGNCPSFYYSKSFHHCLGGWDLSQKPETYREEKNEVLVIFKMNEVFCRQYIPKGWKKTSLPGIDVYEKP